MTCKDGLCLCFLWCFLAFIQISGLFQAGSSRATGWRTHRCCFLLTTRNHLLRHHGTLSFEAENDQKFRKRRTQEKDGCDVLMHPCFDKQNLSKFTVWSTCDTYVAHIWFIYTTFVSCDLHGIWTIQTPFISKAFILQAQMVKPLLVLEPHIDPRQYFLKSRKTKPSGLR